MDALLLHIKPVQGLGSVLILKVLKRYKETVVTWVNGVGRSSVPSIFKVKKTIS